MTLTPELLTSVSAMVISLACSYIPGLAPKWDALATDKKRAVMLGLLALITSAIVGLSCAGWLDPIVTCDRPGFQFAVQTFILALVANQATFLVTKG